LDIQVLKDGIVMNEMNQQPYPPMVTETSTWAIVSLIGGIGGLTILPIVGSIFGIIGGYIAKKEINESNGRLTGKDMATWGLILGWVGVGLVVLGVCLTVFLSLAFGVTLCGISDAMINY
jgi:hypothetical protein